MATPQLAAAAQHFAPIGSLGDIEQWANERLVFDPDSVMSSAELLADYSRWCAARRYQPRTQRALSDYLVRSGVVRRRTTNNRYWLGLGLKP